MARIRPVDFEMVYKLNFETVIRGHHVYKAVWSPEIGKKLECYEDTRKEAKDYDKHSVGIFKLSSKEGKKTLVRHIPVELSSLIDYFLKIQETNRVIAEVTGKRKREVGLAVPAKFTASTMNRRFAHVLDSELNSKKEKYADFELFYKPSCCKRYPVIKI